MPTPRGWAALVLGPVAYAAAWAFGAAVLVPLAALLVLGPLVALWYVRRLRPDDLRLAVAFAPSRPLEGVAFEGVARVRGRAPRGGRVELRVGGRECAATLEPVPGGETRAVLRVPALPRGVHRVDAARFALADPFGLARRERPLAGMPAAVVWPRWDEPERAAGGAGGDGEAQRAARRPSAVGYDLHGIREHRDGESLRRVDWKATARTGRLMVREMEDAANAEEVIVVDLDDALARQGSEAVDALVRVAATAVRGAIAEGGRAVLLLAGAQPHRVPLDGGAASWHAAMDALAAARADRTGPLILALEADPDAALAASITIVSADRGAAAALYERRAGGAAPVRLLRPTGATAEAAP